MKSTDRVVTRTLRHITSRVGACLVLFALAAPALAQQGFDAAPSQSATVPIPPPASTGYPGIHPANAPLNAPREIASSPASGGWPAQDRSPPDAGSGDGNAPAGKDAGPQAGAMRALLQNELQDFGVAPQEQLQTVLHSPTPTRIPGGQVITTDRLLGLYNQAGQNGLLVFHVLGQGPTLPNAQNAGPASQPGTFDDSTQQEFGKYLQQVTRGSKARPLVFYCLNTHCWMSYNASLRAIHMGYSQVYWYRGGVEAWQQVQQLSAGMSAGQPPNLEQRPAAAYAE
ncbi:MAG: rhodanese-like domain-containing protein [Dokdonella sp.]|uniref:rhodanese-like domain-containing protein n=1 Tax=Dokdonella sp. TaxID=2291710 RepID=UPI0032652C04